MTTTRHAVAEYILTLDEETRIDHKLRNAKIVRELVEVMKHIPATFTEEEVAEYFRLHIGRAWHERTREKEDAATTA